MYIFEIIAKLVNKYRDRKIHQSESAPDEDYEGCEHIYLAIDSSKDYLACNKCGHVIKNQKKHSNFFMR